MTSLRLPWRAAPALALVLGAGCNPGAVLAQASLFAGLRADLITACCTCLAQRGTSAPGATCALATCTADGQVCARDPDAGVLPAHAGSTPDSDYNDVVDRGEVPCSCGTDATSCEQLLTHHKPIVVVGGCVQVNAALERAPCGDACDGVLAFVHP